MAELSPERFAAILAAYGAEPRRWPEAERAAALRHLHGRPDAAALLDEAGDLDDLLRLSRVPAPSEALRARVIAAAPRRAAWSRARLWWAAALASVCMAGALAGSAAAAALEPASYAHEEATAFGALPPGLEE